VRRKYFTASDVVNCYLLATDAMAVAIFVADCQVDVAKGCSGSATEVGRGTGSGPECVKTHFEHLSSWYHVWG